MKVVLGFVFLLIGVAPATKATAAAFAAPHVQARSGRSFLCSSVGLDRPAKLHPTRAGVGRSKTRFDTRLHVFDFLNEGKKALIKSLAGDYDTKKIQSRIDDLTATNQVLMFSFTTCPFCIRAKQILDGKKAKYTVVELDVDPEGKAIRAELGNLVGRTSVPAIWISNQFIGGCNDGPPEFGGIATLDNSGKLDSMLQAAGAI
jgi:glutaredoxin 3